MPSPATAIGRRLLWLVPAIGIAQIISWGSLYYSLAVLAAPIRAELGFSELVTFGGLTLGLLISGTAAPYVGRWIDRRGGRGVMSGGAVLAAVALAVLATAQGLLSFAAGWVLAGLAMAACLYDPAFATLHQIAPQHYRRVVTSLTLIAGFASTVFWPLANLLATHWGWREALGLFALLNVGVCAPIYYCMLPGAAGTVTAADAEAAESSLFLPDRRYYWLAASFALSSLVIGALSAFVIAALVSRGFGTADAVWVAALVGPMQVLGRMLEWTVGARLSAVRVGMVASVLLVLAMALLSTMQAALAIGCLFAFCYGAANGVMTIVRGTVPAELYEQARQGALLGGLARPAFLARALAPALIAGILSAGLPMQTALLMLLLSACAALACFVRATAPPHPQTLPQR